jgi:hypothetical protein
MYGTYFIHLLVLMMLNFLFHKKFSFVCKSGWGNDMKGQTTTAAAAAAAQFPLP